jgi:DNA-binding SARP family transcriptional activator
VLLSRAKETFPQEVLSILLRRAAMLLEEDGQTEAAVSILHDVRNWKEIVPLIMKHAPLMIAQGRYRPLEEWLSNLPNEILGNNPWLLYWKGVVYIPFNPSSSRKYLERAFEIFKRKGDAAGTFLSWSSIVEAIWYGLGDFKPLDHWVSVLQDLMRNFKEFPSKEIRARVASSMFIALAVRQPEHPEIEEWAEKALSFLEDHSTINARISVLVRQVFYRSFIGDFAKSELAVNALRNLAQSKDAGPLALIGEKYAESLFYRTIGLPERCLKAVSDGLELSQRTGIHVLDKMILLQGIFSALSANDVEMAGKLLEKMASFSSLTPWEKCNFHLGKAWEALLRNDLKQASLHAEISLKFGMDLGVPFSLRVCHLMKALVMHQIGKNRDASEHLEHALSIAHQTKSKFHYFYVLLAEALFALDRREEASTLESLRKALSIGKEERYFSTPILHSDMARLCIKALEAGIEVEYVQDFIRKHNLIPDNSSLHLENWPWPLKIYTLGRFELQKDGKPVRFLRKAQQRPLSMLKALIAFGGKEVREDQIEDALWPEADGDIAHQSFKITLHRLRKLIGYEKAIQLQEGRLTLDPRHCWVDVWAFEQILEQADAQWKKGWEESAVKLIGKSLEIYKGVFLGREIEQPWGTSMSERLRGKFLRSVGKLALYWQQADQWEKALEYYQKGIEVDALAEEFYQGLMTCYHRLGRRSEALRVYQRCKKNLSSALGIGPSAKTDSIYRLLRS